MTSWPRYDWSGKNRADPNWWRSDLGCLPCDVVLCCGLVVPQVMPKRPAKEWNRAINTTLIIYPKIIRLVVDELTLGWCRVDPILLGWLVSSWHGWVDGLATSWLLSGDKGTKWPAWSWYRVINAMFIIELDGLMPSWPLHWFPGWPRDDLMCWHRVGPWVVSSWFRI